MTAQASSGWSALSDAAEVAAVAAADGVRVLTDTISEHVAPMQPSSSMSTKEAKTGVTTTV